MKIPGAARLFLFLVVAYMLMPALLCAAAVEVEEMPIGVRPTTSNVLEALGGYIHPSLSLSETYNDNPFAANTNKKPDFDTVISPGIWVALPGLVEQAYTLSTSYVSPGGLPLTRFVSAGQRNYEGYILYRGDFERYAKDTSEDSDNQKVEGMFQCNLPGGLLLNMTEQYLKYHTIQGIGASSTLDKYETNSFNTLMSYEINDSFAVRADYSNYPVHYLSGDSIYRNRTDNSASGYVFYKIASRTELFGEYDFANVRYDKNILPGSEEDRVFLGFRKEVTAKTMITVKLGYQIKDFTSSNISNAGDVTFESQIQHAFTPKSSAGLVFSRKTEETDLVGTDYILSSSVSAQFNHNFNAKLTGSLNAAFTDDEYEGGAVTVGSETRNREDRYFSGGVAFVYLFRKWLSTQLGYIYTRKDSNFSTYDFYGNMVTFNIAGSF